MKRPPATLALAALAILTFLWQTKLAVECCSDVLLEILGITANLELLVEAGAAFAGMNLQTDWWRLVTSMFVHGGLIHLTLNLIALLQLGQLLETFFGAPALLVSFLAGGIVAGLATLAVPTPAGMVYVGASGGIFAIAGTLFMALRRAWRAEREHWSHRLSNRLFGCMALNLGLGLAVSAIAAWFGSGFVIANTAHLAGLVTGIAVGLVPLPMRRNPATQRLIRLFTPPPPPPPKPPAGPFDI